jgi:hypothetical protein
MPTIEGFSAGASPPAAFATGLADALVADTASARAATSTTRKVLLWRIIYLISLSRVQDLGRPV